MTSAASTPAAAPSVLAALYARERTGRRVDVDLLGSLLAALVNQASAYLNGGAMPGRLGNRHPSVAPYAAHRRPADRGRQRQPVRPVL
jgi:crotonobetainyl-CoA:carnitine CoA-transferase CaiB-like acyl-CoA transferase